LITWEELPCEMKTKLVGAVLLWLLMNTSMSFAQEAPDVFQGYEGEWNHVSEQLIARRRQRNLRGGRRPESAPPAKCICTLCEQIS